MSDENDTLVDLSGGIEAGDIVFSTASVERLRITADGKFIVNGKTEATDAADIAEGLRAMIRTARWFPNERQNAQATEGDAHAVDRVAHLVELTAREAGFPPVTPDAAGFRVFALGPHPARPAVVGVEHAKGDLELLIRQSRVEVAGIVALNALTCMTGPCAPEHPIGERVKRAQARAEELAEYLRA